MNVYDNRINYIFSKYYKMKNPNGAGRRNKSLMVRLDIPTEKYNNIYRQSVKHNINMSIIVNRLIGLTLRNKFNLKYLNIDFLLKEDKPKLYHFAVKSDKLSDFRVRCKLNSLNMNKVVNNLLWYVSNDLDSNKIK